MKVCVTIFMTATRYGLRDARETTIQIDGTGLSQQEIEKALAAKAQAELDRVFPNRDQWAYKNVAFGPIKKG
jgi:hypothetical protein